MGDELIRSVGIGNLNRVLAHGEEIGVKRVKPENSEASQNEVPSYEIPADPPVPGKRIFDEAIMRFEQNRPKGREDAQRIAGRRTLACETADEFKNGGLKSFVDELAKGMKVKDGDKRSRAVMTRIAEQLFASKAVVWWAKYALPNCGEGKAVADVDRVVGREITWDKLLDAAATLTVMVRRGELDIEHVETYLNETVYDFADKKTVLQMTARAMGEMRAKVLQFGWGDRYADLVRRYSDAVKNVPNGRIGQFESTFDKLKNKASAIRVARQDLVRKLGLDGVMLKPDDDPDTVLSAFRQRLKFAGNALELSRHSYGVSGALDDDKNFAADKVKEFLDAAKEMEELLGKPQKPEAPEGWTLVDEFTDTDAKTSFTPSFKDTLADGVKLLDQGLELTSRLDREEAIRAAFKEAISGIETGKNGLCQPGVYQLSIAVGVGAGADLAGGEKVSAKAKLSAQVTVVIGEDGSASVAHGFSVGLEVGAEAKIPAVKVKVGGDLSASVKNSTNYKNIDDLCNGMSRAILAIATGKELGNVFHAGSANAKSMAMSRKLDNYAMRAHLGNLGLLDDTDRYLTPLRNDKVVGETKSGSIKGGAKVSVSAGSDEDTFLYKSGFSASLAGNAGVTLSKTIKYRTHFDVAREAWDDPKYLHDPTDPTDRDTRIRNLKNRLVALRAELDDFTRAAAAQSGGSKYSSARPKISYRQHLANRGIVLNGWNAFRNIFQGNIRRTLFLTEIAKEAADCEARLRRELTDRDGVIEFGVKPEPVDLPEDVEHTIRMIEEGIYGRCGLQLNTAVAKNCLYVSEEKRKVAVSSGFAADAGVRLPDTATAPGLSATVTFGYSYDPENPDLEPRPWDTRNSATIAIGFNDIPGVDVIVDAVMSKLDKLMSVKDLESFGYRELVAKQVNELVKKHAKDWVPPSGMLAEKISHTLTVNVVRTGTGLRLGEISFSRSHMQSIGANTPDFGVSASLSLSRMNDKVLGYSLGTNTLNGIMSRYERFGKNPVLWGELLELQSGNVSALVKNMLQPPEIPPPEQDRPGVAGELDMILKQMINHGSRTSVDALVAAWEKVAATAAGNDDKARGAALTALLKTISDFYTDADWRTWNEIPSKVPEAKVRLPKYGVQTTKSSLCHMWSVVNALRMSEAGVKHLNGFVKIDADTGSFMVYDKNAKEWRKVTEEACKEKLAKTDGGEAFIRAVEEEFGIMEPFERTFLYYTYLNDETYRKSFGEKLAQLGDDIADGSLPYGDARRTAAAFNLVVETDDMSLSDELEEPMSARAEKVRNALKDGRIAVIQVDGHYMTVKDVVCDKTNRTLTVSGVDSTDGKEFRTVYPFGKLSSASIEIYRLP